MTTATSFSTALVLLVLTIFVSVTVTTVRQPLSQWRTAVLWCCNETQAGQGNVVSALLVLLGIVADLISALVGSGCTSINALGIGAGGMCTNNNFVSFLSFCEGCAPVTNGALSVVLCCWAM
ncbi:hydrophobin [Laccaria bicolor S238N-H82]|uniref:Hydrophobin n=1 Tax=Laccaria bicolor (strain S238N-H82 / ATCC MYA-4686) TaxID=486041 RepID=B0DG18_LACBS|nr:hydrophobin [Laccaria bicolor S238N-H82]EDR06437.1 hydrophobin [Laccaria bicolor S238N-H82]|eukprot:XP_001882809.1 hydrophobin [Laccaria bicolor S238N-H82]